jgi:DNA repair protein RecO (recombination protein O)
MLRNSNTQSVVFSLKPLGENNSSVRFLTADNGIVYATLYGGSRSKLRSLVSPWNSGMAYFYTNETTHSVKITDFDVTNYHLSFRTSLYKTYGASLAAELAIRTKCAGSTRKCFTLLSGYFDGLELSTETQARTGTIRFLWRYLSLLGIQPDAGRCAGCGKAFYTGIFPDIGVSYEPAENGFLCADCTEASETATSVSDRPFFLNVQAVQYLALVSVLEPSAVRALPLTSESEDQLKRLLFFLAEQAAGTQLKSLETGIGIL